MTEDDDRSTEAGPGSMWLDGACCMTGACCWTLRLLSVVVIVLGTEKHFCGIAAATQ